MRKRTPMGWTAEDCETCGFDARHIRHVSVFEDAGGHKFKPHRKHSFALVFTNRPTKADGSMKYVVYYFECTTCGKEEQILSGKFWSMRVPFKWPDFNKAFASFNESFRAVEDAFAEWDAREEQS